MEKSLGFRARCARPGEVRELGGEPIARLLPEAALPRPRRDSLGGDPRRESRHAGCSRCSSQALGGPPRWLGRCSSLRSALAASLRPVHWTPVSLRIQVTEGGTPGQCPPRVPTHTLLLSAAEPRSLGATWRCKLESLLLDSGASDNCQGRHLHPCTPSPREGGTAFPQAFLRIQFFSLN